MSRTVLSLYTGAGGLDYGLEAAGFEILGCVERDPDARRSITASRGWQLARLPDIADYSPSDLLTELGLQEGQVGVLSAGPPCQPFSKAGWWYRDARRLGDPRAETLGMLMDVVEATLPHVLLIENVRGLSYRGRGEGIDLIAERLAAINATRGTSYSLHTIQLNAVDFGVAQRRERLFLCAGRDGERIAAPAPTHGPNCTEVHRTAWDALGDAPPVGDDDLNPSGKWAGVLPSIPEGQNYIWHTSRGAGAPLFGYRTRYWSFLLKLAKAQPSWTLPAQPGPATGPFHWSSRKLSRSELMRLQTFPDDADIKGSYRSAYRQIGNAVPSAVGEALGHAILMVVDGVANDQPLSLATPRRPGCPPPEVVADLPAEILEKYSGEHRDHPGEGKGPGASARASRSVQASSPSSLGGAAGE